ncbi:replication factor C small subunit [Halopenitus sp. H-Gu1]|uniref:replication factor C small subunit n=1 Tax=Halopenitus sp. H-Gu1 TaxID=3242697 RepID=UPI00359D451E
MSDPGEPADSADGDTNADPTADSEVDPDGTSDAETDTEAATAAGREIWIEKYRPQTLSDIHGQEDIVERLESYIEQDDLPHLLFSGPAGVGKCVTGETPVLTSEGIHRIEDVVGDVDGFSSPPNDLSIATLTDRNDFEYVPPSDVFAKETDELVRITTRDGGAFRVTPEHKLRVITEDGFEWVQAADLSATDRIVRPRSLPTPQSTAETPGSTTDRGSDPIPSLRWFEQMDPDRTEVTISRSSLGDFDPPGESDIDGATSLDTPIRLSKLRESDLTPGEWVPAVEAIECVNANGYRSPAITPPTTVTPELARFVGLAISEARIDGGSIEFSNTDETLLDAFETAAHDVFDVETKRGVQGDVPFVRVGSRTLTHYLESVFDVFTSASGGDAIGSAIVSSDDASRAAFLRAVFDTESHVTTGGTIELTQRNPDHITLASYLLATFDIPCRRKTFETSATNGTGIERTHHAVSLSGATALERFADRVGFSIGYKAERLREHASKNTSPNHDTIPAQTVFRELCDRLDIPVTDHLPKSLDSETPGRERYCSALDDVVSAAADRIETVQRALERLDRIEPMLAGTTSLPATWDETRNALEPIEMQSAGSESIGIRSDRMGDPSSDRPLDSATLDVVQEELRACRDLIGVSNVEIADGLAIGPSDLANLLETDKHAVRTVTRFETVAERLREVALNRLSVETIELIDEARKVANADLYYDRVESVDRIETDERVYDLTVPGTRNYVAGEIPTVMHNTTSATAIAREIYGEDWRGNFLELNASDQRGIDVVRDRIKNFARSSFGGHDYRIIFLDEADSLTDDAQSALRRTMEQFSDNTRFILSCNYSSKIIDPIQSRCAVFRFSPLSDEAIASQVREIAVAEDIEVTEEGVDALVYAANGDMRRAINSLQAAATTGEVVDEEAVYAITATARPEEIESMVTDALNGDFSKARATLDTLLTETGMAGGDVIDQLHRSVWEFDLDEREAVRLMERVGEADYRITEGANEQVQLESLLASLSLPADGETGGGSTDRKSGADEEA